MVEHIENKCNWF